MTVTVDLDETTITKLRELKRLRQVIKETHGFMESCGGCSTCEYEKSLCRELEGRVTWLVSQAVE